MAGYRRIKNVVAAENGEASIIVGQEGLKVPSADANLAAGSSTKRTDGRNARLTPNKEGKLMAGQVTKLTGVPASKLRHYEGMGLLTPECTGIGVSNNRRLYGVQDLERLQAVLTLAEYDFGLSEIKQILDDESVDLYGAVALKLEELKRKEARLRALILFTKFVDITDDADLIEGLACGPASLDGFADLARALPDYEQAMQRLDAYSEEEAALALERVAATIDALVLLDEIEGFAGVEAATDAFFGWWSEFIVPAEELGYLGFWAIFEDQSLVAEYVETIGGAGDAATLQMLVFFVMLTRFIRANDTLICEIAQLADSDVVAAIDLAYDLIAASGIIWLGTKGARETPGDALAALCFSLLVFTDRALEDEWLRAYLGLERTISCDGEALASTLRVVDVMCGE